MTTKGIPAAMVLRILGSVANVAWGRFGTGSTADGPAAPLVVWRYHDEPKWAAGVMMNAVATFEGRYTWVLEKPGRNWVLWPDREKQEFESGYWASDAEYLALLAERDPEFCDRATADLRDLFDHLAATLHDRDT